ncbi:hypothetical protein GCM10008018_72820 [Paenibacillus marchantiophytorum]|uniref:DUF4261 domain-containing protein n=1 Tax=Paenibacillus marchantiophytorum TaxID=1619310 RepID=A0ABQ1FK99_9BACL|nr:hypothetical protein [Paenibacillus marchantiophytorum]GGA18307.1 hypothetical protein GCM10008018_72820 [Paenibacillus marchantiophytorum]
MEYLLGGYYLVKPMKRANYLDKEIMPEEILSASNCICDNYPDIGVCWDKSESKKQEYMKQLNLSQDSFTSMEQWVEQEFDSKKLGFPHVFMSVQSAREFYHRYLNHITGIKLIGIGLPPEIIENLKEDFGAEGFFYGVEYNISQNKILEMNGNTLGYEILGYEYGAFHSYICNSLFEYYNKNISFSLNENGFIRTLDEAYRLSQYTNDEIKGTEPVLWLPWIVIEYLLN